MPENSDFQVEMVNAKLKKKNKTKSPGIDQIPAELIKAGGGIIGWQIDTFINSTWNKDRMPR